MTEEIAFVLTVAGLAGVLTFSFLRRRSGGGSNIPSLRAGGTLAAFTRDLTESAREGKLDPFSGREEETERVIHIILRRTKNNPLLLGEPGVGKTAVVEGLAKRIVSGDVPAALKGKRLLALDLNALISETKFRGELEKRLQELTREIEARGGELILFIDEIHMLGAVGRAEGSLSVADVLKPALARGKIAVIGATTWDEYEKYVRPDAAMDRRLQPVLVEEPTPEQAIRILKGLRKAYEGFHGVTISDEAIKAAVHLSDKKIKGRFLPDKAIDLIDEASSKVSIEASCDRMVAAGLVHAAAKKVKKGCEVSRADIEAVVEQWVAHARRGTV
ncbi:hypothetical protein A2856_02785 [Candidatus Uhrbacteria bacterium RIFCSPHIGHO2_01_FULL_63_20]|uniref:AAA+ ATPase domain-containing protein n=1 Tax=Candidatus Uhrbacteria bacterium RIFCSPHIGHO2_01_FULL_63_20 TaxID=1802385 RepID=A0A1F7TM05_9BACT|nr:MAG: hypothetical protein A2856_02785 [Candidatus Uhrbacteria bacterium RIFCSPHIGHO2_01_FULL_63_20]